MAKILIADDYPDFTDALTSIFKFEGYEVETALSEEELKSALPVFHPDIVLLDIKFKGMDGRELCRELKLKTPSGPSFILLSESCELAKDYMKYKADEVVIKPFELVEIFEKVHSVLKHQEQD